MPDKSSVHWSRETDRLKQFITSQGKLVEERVIMALQAVFSQDVELAERVINGDSQIDELEVELEEACLKALALHQPVAFDLRFTVAVLKINNDLERIADLAANIAYSSKKIAHRSVRDSYPQIDSMAKAIRQMLRESLQSLIEIDSSQARRVLAADDEVDELHNQIYLQLTEELKTNPAQASEYLNVLAISRNLERVADLTSNIAEDVIYLVEGEIVRHRELASENEK